MFAPESHADLIREAMGRAGAGKIGNHNCFSFFSKGIGKFKPEQGARPTIGEVGKLESIKEERIEFVRSRNILKDVIAAIKRRVHMNKSR